MIIAKKTSRMQCTRLEELFLDLAEPHEGPAAAPLVDVRARDDLADDLAIVVDRIGAQGAVTVMPIEQAVVVVEDRGMVTSKPTDTEPLDERARVSVEPEPAEVPAHRIGSDSGPGRELRLPDQNLEPLALAADRLAVDGAIVVPIRVVGVEVAAGEVALFHEERRQVDGRDVGNDDDVVGRRDDRRRRLLHNLFALFHLCREREDLGVRKSSFFNRPFDLRHGAKPGDETLESLAIKTGLGNESQPFLRLSEGGLGIFHGVPLFLWQSRLSRVPCKRTSADGRTRFPFGMCISYHIMAWRSNPPLTDERPVGSPLRKIN